MARPERFELPTPWFVARYSIQLSYGRTDTDKPLLYLKPKSLTFPLSKGRGSCFFYIIYRWRRERDSNPRWSC
jgi:hypothetical protein